MSIKIFGTKETLDSKRKRNLSDAIHSSMVETLGLPSGKRAHRFINLEPEDLFVPEGRSMNYVTLEIMLMTGRAPETKHKLIKTLFAKIKESAGIDPNDLEIVIIESSHENCGLELKHCYTLYEQGV